MPTYDYECQKCGIRFEVFQSMKDPKLETCTAEGCDGAVKRLLGTGAGLIFKGAGFYQTDYRSSSYQAGAKAEGGTGGDTAKSGGAPKSETGKSDSKPAAAAPAKPAD